MTGNEYQALAGRTIAAEDLLSMRTHALAGLVSEIGELLGIYQKKFQGHAVIEEHAMKETGDILWMLAEYCTSNGWQLEDVMALNIEKLKARYPDGFEIERSLHRQEGDI